jgi:hypothetical protein
MASKDVLDVFALMEGEFGSGTFEKEAEQAQKHQKVGAVPASLW